MTNYRLAGQEILIVPPIAALASFASCESHVASGLLRMAPRVETLVSKAAGVVGGSVRDVELWRAPGGTCVRVDGSRDVYVDCDGRSIVSAAVEESDAFTGLDAEVMLGPALVFALALCGTWCLHGGAVMHRDAVVAILGESGQGKSTLASYLGGTRDGWTLVADDILPVTAKAGAVTAWPHFPQLKLAPDSQPASSLLEQLPVAAIVVLEVAARDVEPRLERLSPGEGLKGLLSHTAGSRLYDQALLEAHLDFCARAAAGVPAFRLVYPHRRDVLPRVAELLERSI